MSSLRLIFNRQSVGYFIAAAAILLAAFIPALAMAADVSERSIELSSSSKGATAVQATIKFKASGAASAFVVDFCNESPIYGATCTAPTGLVVDTATSATTNFTDTATPTAAASATAHNQRIITKSSTIAAAENVTVVLSGITNPTTTGTIYARIVTFDTKTNAQAYVSADSTQTGKIDNGGVAIPITDSIGVSGAVLESMTFCVASGVIAAGCDVSGLTDPAPTLELGTDPGTGVKSLVAGTINTGDIWTQITTNATGGAVINLKSNATGCGGLINSSNPSACYIGPALKTGINGSTEAKFGVKLDTPTGTGALIAAGSSGYNASTYALNWASDNATGVTSTYGDPFLTTNNLPASNMTMKLTFGASAQADTPAGIYAADLGLIATGKF